MTIQVKHSKVSTIPDTTDTSLVRPSDWNADHTLVGLGTMAEQNANAVAITGGTINGTTIGATSATTVNATTLSGQTGVLRGTGQNLILRSQNFGTTWTNASVTITANSTTAPDATNTASTIAASSTGTNRRVWQGFTSYSGLTYTASFYAKPLTTSWVYIQLSDNTANANGYYFDVTNGVVGTNTGLSAGTGVTLVSSSITSAGNGWYRCSVTVSFSVSASFSTNNGVVDANSSATATSGASAYFWGAQVEVGNTANTYIPTTTTAVYGTPTLSFSGVSTLGLESNGALFLQPAGTGAIQAQATTSTTAGGNVRGANAVDWQTTRATAAQVASAINSVVGGGANNIASGAYGFVGGGIGNTASGIGSASVGGNTVLATGTYSVGGGGNTNTASGYYGAILSGQSNTAAGYYNFIGGGFTNSGTSGSAVTTQSGTMNATTAVTLSGSNANIKVGQLITGTSIAVFTYVAAISGTSLTLSQAASGSSTSTLSFFTPHGVVVGGGNNQATGSYSFIGGGGDAGTAANRNVASGDWSFVGGGVKNVASGLQSVISGGSSNTASGQWSFIGGGTSHTATGTSSVVAGGYINVANGEYSSVLGGVRGTTRSIAGFYAMPAHVNPIADVAGVSQAGLLILGTQTTDATPTALRSNTSAAGTTNQVILPNNSAYYFRGEVISGVTGGGDTKGFFIEGVIKRGANAASTALVGTPTVTSNYADAGASAWAIAVTANTTNGGLRVTFTGQASTTIRTVAQIRTTEMTY